MPDLTAPAQLSAELGYSQVTGSVNIVSTTEATGTTLITGASITFDGSPVMLRFFCPQVTTESVITDSVTFSLFEGATQIGRLGACRPSAIAVMFLPVNLEYRFTPTAGAHTYTITAFCAAITGTPSAAAGVAGTAAMVPMFMRFTKA